MKIFTLKIAGLASSLLIGFNALGVDIYNSYTTSYTPFALGNNQEVGNEIKLSSANVTLTGFNFEYFTPAGQSQSSGIQVDLKLYKNDGSPVGGFVPPGTLIYNSGFFGITTPAPGSGPPAAPTGGLDVNYNASDFGGGILLPTDFTFTLTFQGLTGGNVVELLLGAPPSGQIGKTTPDYWINTGSGFSLQTQSPNPSDIGAEFIGTVKASDAPVTAGLLGLGFMGMFVLRRKFATSQV